MDLILIVGPQAVGKMTIGSELEKYVDAKPSKRHLDFSENELLESAEKHRLNSHSGEVQKRLPSVNYIKINNTFLEAAVVAKTIYEWMLKVGY